MAEARKSTYLKLAVGAAALAVAALASLFALLQDAPPAAQSQDIPFVVEETSTFYSWNGMTGLTIMESAESATITVARDRVGGPSARFAIRIVPPLPISRGMITMAGDTTTAVVNSNDEQIRIDFGNILEAVDFVNLVYTRTGTDDSTPEADLTFNLQLRFAIGVQTRYFTQDVVVNLLDDDPPRYGFYNPATRGAETNTIDVAEGGSFSLRAFEAFGATMTTPVTLSATSDDIMLTDPGSTTIAAGETVSAGTLDITLADDNLYTGDRQVQIMLVASGGTLTGPGDYSTIPLNINVQENDVPSVRVVAAEDGQDGSEVRFMVVSAPGGPRIMRNVAVQLEVDAPDALLAANLPTSVTFMAGAENAPVTLNKLNDGSFSGPPRPVTLSVADPGDGSYEPAGDATQQVWDADVPVVQVENPGTRMVTEGDETQGITVRLSAGSPTLAALLEVMLQVEGPASNISAVGGGVLQETITIDTATTSSLLGVQIVDDTVYEGGGLLDSIITITAPASGFYAVSDTATMVTLSVLDNESAPQATLPDEPGNNVEVVESDTGAPVVQVPEARTASLMFSTNYAEGTVLAIAADARQLRLPSASVTVGPGGAVEIPLNPQSVTRVVEAVLTLTPQGAAAGLSPLMLTVRIDNNVADVTFFADSPLVPQTGGVELGWQLWLVALAAVALFAAAAVLAARRRAPR